ncbi:MAG: amidase family protein, partial [Acidobacteriota bacterium]|nr:amidase family protein [Acidobacteriota bacterium]
MPRATINRREFISTSLAFAALGLNSRAVAQPTDPTKATISQAYPLIRSGELSPVELVNAYLDRIRQLDDRLNAFITVTDERAVVRARELERELVEGNWRGPLHGIPIALKDNIDTKGVLTT